MHISIIVYADVILLWGKRNFNIAASHITDEVQTSVTMIIEDTAY